MAEVKGFTFWENYYTTISDPENGLSEDEKGQLYKALIEYIFDGKKPDFKGILRAIFSALLPSLDLSKTRSQSRKNGKKKETNENQMQIKTQSKQEQTKIKTQSNANQSEVCDLYIKKKKESIILTDNTKREDIKGDCKGGILVSQKRFFDENTGIVFDNYDPSLLAELTDDNWKIACEQFQKSEWLRLNVKTVSMLCRLMPRILAGQYAPFDDGKGKNGEEISEDERIENAKWFDETFGKTDE